MGLDDDWIRAEPLIDRALKASNEAFTTADIYEKLFLGEARLFVGKASALVALIDRQPLAAVLQIWLASGDMAELVNNLRPAAERWALAEGCSRAMVLGRPGWAHVLKSQGYAETARLLEKEL